MGDTRHFHYVTLRSLEINEVRIILADVIVHRNLVASVSFVSGFPVSPATCVNFLFSRLYSIKFSKKIKCLYSSMERIKKHCL